MVNSWATPLRTACASGIACSMALLLRKFTTATMWSSSLIHIEFGGKKTSVTDHHLVYTTAGLVPARTLTVGSALLTKETVTSVQREESQAMVSLIYTRSGRFVADGAVVSSYEHWSDPWLSLDTYVLHLLQATHILESRWYKAYFRMESAFTDPLVHWLWPYA